jgi:hypothetical protein
MSRETLYGPPVYNRPEYVVDLSDSAEWIDDTPTRFYDREGPTPLPLIVRRTPVPVAEGMRPVLTLEYRDLIVLIPWALMFGVIAGRMGGHVWMAAVAAAAFGVLFDRVLRRFI